jgi:hypothetical protein
MMLMNVLGLSNCSLWLGCGLVRPKDCSLGLGFVSNLPWFVMNALLFL